MAKGEYHIGPNGPAPCGVDLSNPRSTGCPFGGASGTDNHFKTAAEAEGAYARQMEEKGHGLVANAAVSSTKLSAQDAALKEKCQKTLNELVADSSYGVSHDPKLGFLADSSEGLERLRNDFTDRLDGDSDPDVNYEPDSDGEVIRSVYIAELDIEIENQNFDDDMRELGEYRQMRADDGREYWR